MIVPSGKRKHQVLQGASKHTSILDSDIFDKIAIGNLPGKVPGNVTNQVDTGDVGRAMGQGGLDPARHDKNNPQPDQGFDPSKRSIQPNAPQDPSMGAPGGGAPGGGVPADQFLGPAPTDPNDSMVDPFQGERDKLRQFLGYQNYGVDMKPGNDGSFEVTIMPPQGSPVDVGGLLQGLQKHVGGKWSGESTPAANTGGPIKFKYIPQGMETDNKVMKPGKGGR